MEMIKLEAWDHVILHILIDTYTTQHLDYF